MQRDPYFDNLRFILIAFVVVGHFALVYQAGAYSHSIYTLKNWIWIFHMPAFLFVSGLFAKRIYVPSRGLDMNAIAFYLVMYVLFSIVIQLVSMTYSDAKFDLFHVYAIPWYFLALAILGASLPIVAHIRGGAKAVVPLAIAFAVLAGGSDGFGSFLSSGRIMNFAPFYFLGYFLDREVFERMVDVVQSKRLYVVLDVVFLAAIFVVLWVVPSEISSTMNALSMAYTPYAHCGELPLPAIVFMRVVWFALAFAMTFCVSALVPRRKVFYSEMGQRTLQVYLLHPLIYLPIRGFKVIPLFIPPAFMLDGWTVVVFGLAVTFLLAWPQAPARLLKRFQRSIRVSNLQ